MLGEFEKPEELEEKKLIAPDYSDISDDDDCDDDDLDEETITTDEGETLEEIYEQQEKLNEKNMTASPFQAPSWGETNWHSPVSNNTPSWAIPSTKPADPWTNSGNNSWRIGSANSFQPNRGIEINRKKRIIFCDLLDCITETYQSDGRPGLRPRDIYDFKFRFDVWQKIAAFNPEKVFIMIPQNLLPASANGLNSWEISLGYFCCCLSAFLRLPDENCQVLLQSRVGQRKEEIIKTTINRLQGVSLDDIIQIGIYSGLNGLSDMDKIAAESCGIDYVDLYQLLNAI